jgi:hypothetical protein
MMIESFGEYGYGIQFDDVNSDAAVFKLKPNDVLHGVGCIIEGILVAFYKNECGYFIRVGEDIWNANDQTLSIEFCHESEGVSCFTIKQGGATLRKLIYSAWWLRQSDCAPPGLGDADDEENDFGAYLAFMWKADTRIKHLMQTYC